MFEGYNLLLASKSPRRQHILRECGIPFRLCPVDVEEEISDYIPPNQVARYLAEKKASHITNLARKEILLTADTTVILNDAILGKPANRDESFTMLSSLSGRMHLVVTGVCLKTRDKIVSFDDVTRVYFKKLLDREIDFYIEHYKPYDKAGSYGIQEWIGLIGIRKIEGSYFNVMGLPIHRVYEALKSISTGG
jgi:septum formation protein